MEYCVKKMINKKKESYASCGGPLLAAKGKIAHTNLLNMAV
jgi:hypothetical protein